MSRFVTVAIGLLLLACSCRDRLAPALRVDIQAIPSATSRLEAQLTLNGRPAREPISWDAPPGGFHDAESFVVDLALTDTGMLQLTITGRDADGCTTAGGDGKIPDVTAGRGTTVALATEGRAGCLLRVDVSDPSLGSVSVPAASCDAGCTLLEPKASAVALTAQPKSGGAFSNWSGDCSGDGACTVTMDRPRHVSTAFGPRGLGFVRGFGGRDSSERIYGTTIDPEGNVYVVGLFPSQQLFTRTDMEAPGAAPLLTSVGNGDGFVVKMDPAGQVLWAKAFGSPQYDDLQGVAVVGDQVYVGGSVEGAATFDGKIFATTHPGIVVLVLSAADGSLLRGRAISSPVEETTRKLAVRSDGSVIIAGVSVPGGRRDGLIYALAPDLSTLRRLSFGGVLQDWSDQTGVNGMAIDASGGVLVCGNFDKTITFPGQTVTSVGGDDAYVLSLTAALDPRWVTPFGGSGNDSAGGIGISPTGAIVMGGQFATTITLGAHTLTSQGPLDSVLATLDPVAGLFQNAVSFGGPDYDGVTAVAVDPQGGVAVLGFSGRVNQTFEPDLFMAWLTPSLTLVRTEAFNGAADSNFGYAIAVDKGNTVGVGTFGGVTNPAGRQLPSIGGLDGFVVKWASWP